MLVLFPEFLTDLSLPFTRKSLLSTLPPLLVLVGLFELAGRDFAVPEGRVWALDDGRFVVVFGLSYVFDCGLVEERLAPPLMERLPLGLLCCLAPPAL